MKNPLIFLVIVCLFMFTTCSKPGPGGKASITVSVKASKLTSRNTNVFLKYDTKTAPGTTADSYDEVAITNEVGEVYFTNLKKGDYFVFASGFDSLLMVAASGGAAVTIKKRTESLEELITMN